MEWYKSVGLNIYIPSILYRMYSVRLGKTQPQEGALDTMWYMNVYPFMNIASVNFGCLLKQQDFVKYLAILCRV